MAQRRYKAFISYSHRDKKIASWLHHALETYRPPGANKSDGEPERLQPIFKDREELPAADNLGHQIAQAIAASDALIVLCSPAAAKSRWIAKEIDTYKRINGDRNVFPVIVSGEPPENFPAPLLVHYESGEPTDRIAEPIAADMRPEGDGRKLAKLKLVAGLTGLQLDSLVQRDAARRQRRTAMVAAASLVGMAGTSALSVYAIDQRNDAREQRAEADGLIEYMLTDLREQLEPVGRLQLLDGVGKRAMDYYARQKLNDLSDTELGRRVRAIQLVAEVQNLRGNNSEALPAFQQAARTTGALLARAPSDPERMFNHGQSLFWVGYIAWQRGEMAEARRAMEQYSDISTRLASMDRANLDWQMEEAYSLSNLGTLARDVRDHAKALDYFTRSAAIIDRVSRTEGRPVTRQTELGEGLSWVSTVHLALGNTDDAIRSRARELSIYSEILDADPANLEVRKSRAFALTDLGRLQRMSGQLDAALLNLATANEEIDRVLAADPENTIVRELAFAALFNRALLNWKLGRDRQASSDFDRAESFIEGMSGLDRDNRQWSVENPARLDFYRALTDQRSTPAPERAAMAGRWIGAMDRANEREAAILPFAYFVLGDAFGGMGDSEKAERAYRQVTSAVASNLDQAQFENLGLARLAAKRLGEQSLSTKFSAELQRRGIDPVLDDRLASP